MQNDISKCKNIFRKFLAITILGVIFSIQTGFVLAGDIPDGGWCCENNECKSDKCCCSPDCSTDSSGIQIRDKTGICGNTNCSNIICPFSSHKSLSSLITTISNYIFYLGIVLAPLMIVIGAFLFMTSGGSPEKTRLGKSIIIWAVIGLGFILFAKAVSGVISGILFG